MSQFSLTVTWKWQDGRYAGNLCLNFRVQLVDVSKMVGEVSNILEQVGYTVDLDEVTEMNFMCMILSGINGKNE